MDLDCLVVSYPKSGRTWLRVFFVRYSGKRWRVDLDDFRKGECPAVRFSHNYMTKRHQEVCEVPHIIDQDAIRGISFGTVVRDPRDVVVSYYHHRVFRQNVFDGSFRDFVLSPTFGIERQSHFVNLLLDFHEEHPGAKFLFTYEMLTKYQRPLFRRFAEFVFQDVDEECFEFALQESTFSRMKEVERELYSDPEKVEGYWPKMGSSPI